MSVRVMTIVWGLDLPDSEKIVLLALADCANDEGHCWPSIRSLMAKCSKSDRTIQAAIKRLVDGGHLTRREVPGKGCNYTVHPRRDVTPEATSPPKGMTQTPEAASDKPSRTINSEAKASSGRVVQAWKNMAKRTGLPDVRVMDASRRQSLRLRIKEVGEDELIRAIGLIEASAWLRGEGRDSNWRPDFDFLLSPSKLRRLLEGGYGADKPKDRALSDEETAAMLDDRAAFYRRINREDDAVDCERRAASLRDGRGSGGPVPAGIAAQKFLEGVRPQ